MMNLIQSFTAIHNSNHSWDKGKIADWLKAKNAVHGMMMSRQWVLIWMRSTVAENCPALQTALGMHKHFHFVNLAVIITPA